MNKKKPIIVLFESINLNNYGICLRKYLLIFLTLFAFPIFNFGQTYTIGSDTIYKINNIYCYITPVDTVLADTTVVTINFIDTFSASSRSSFESLNNLTFITETAYGNRQYYMPSGVNYVFHCNSIISDNNVETLITHFFMEPASHPTPFSPDDYYLEDQWYLEKLGVIGINNNYGAWDITKGSSEVIVAVLDFGLQWDLEEFGPVDNSFDVVYHNSGEDDWGDWDDPEDGNGQDDDGNDLIDDLRGYDFFHVPANSIPVEDNDVRQRHSDLNHGTSVTGIIAAKTNNEEGVSGIAGGNISNNNIGVKILPIKVGDLTYNSISGKWKPYIKTTAVEKAICYAVARGANIINMSFKSNITGSITLDTEIQLAHDSKIFIVAAAGNEAYSDKISYPARMEHVIAVGATEDDDDIWFDTETGLGSNKGPELDLVAPGKDIYVLDNDGNANKGSGTSFSSPMVAATAALMMSVNPLLKSNPDRVEEILKETAEKVHSEIYPYVNGWNKRFGFGRINTYAAVCAAIEEKPEIVVSSDQVWSENVFSKKNITIKSGSKLTVTSSIYMGSGTQIIIEPGAELLIFGGQLTNFPFCGEEELQWDGIEVWGTGSGHQFEINNQYQQGLLVLQNNAVIENAVCAVRLFDRGDWTKTGGIVMAKDAYFRNNSRSVSIFPYKNIYSGNEYDYNSWFKNCIFSLDDEFFFDDIGPMVLLYGVKGLDFEGCNFYNEKSGDPSGIGIQSIDAGFKIEGYCTNSMANPCPSADYQPTSFANLYRAIEGSNSANTLYSIDITESVFNNNAWGIYFSAINDATIVDNEFILGYHNTCTYTSSTGIFMDNCKRFAVEENDFMLQATPAAIINTGIQIYNTNNRFDEIYKNTFDNMLIGNFAKGKNWEEFNHKGLAYFCNTNTANEWDFYVGEYTEDFDGIQKNQGSRYYTAGNTFSSQATMHFDNRGYYELEYYYDLNYQNETPDNTKLHWVNPNPEDLDNTCPSHYAGGDTRLTSSLVQQRQTEYNQALSSYNTAKTQYDSLGPLGDSATRRQLDEQMSYYNQQLSRSAYDIIRSELADTLVQSTEINTWLLNLANYTADESRVDLLIQQDNYNHALALMDSLAIKYTFTAYDSVEYPFYQTFKTLQSCWLANRRSIFELTATEINQLSAIADNSNGIAGAQARGMLAFAYPDQYQYVDCIHMPDTTVKSLPFYDLGNTFNETISINAKPNPASRQISFDYFYMPENGSGTLSIWNTNGQLILTIKLNDNKGKEVVNIEHWKEGVYFYNLSNKRHSKTGKFIVVK